MNANTLRALRRHRFREALALLLFAGLLLQSVQAAAPGWWSSQSVLKPLALADDYAALNQGQLKLLASRAWLQMELTLLGGAGTPVTQMINGWRLTKPQTDDYAVVNAGQLKNVARPFYERLAGLGLLGLPPWMAQAGNADDYAVVNLGQAKTIFSFVLPQAASNAPQRLSGNGMSGLGNVTLPSGYTWGSGPPSPTDTAATVPGLLPATTQDVVDYSYGPTDWAKLASPEPLYFESQLASGVVSVNPKYKLDENGHFKLDENGNEIRDGTQSSGAAYSYPGGDYLDTIDSSGALSSALENLSQINEESSGGFDVLSTLLQSSYVDFGDDSSTWNGEQAQYRLFGGGATPDQPRDCWFRIERRILDVDEILSREVEIKPYTIAATRDQAGVMSVSSEHWNVSGQSEEVYVSLIYPEVLQVNDGDADGDDVPDFADGISTTYPDPADVPDLPETAALVNVTPGSWSTQAKIRFRYNASDPASVSVTTGSDGEKTYQPAAGVLRLWRQQLFQSHQVNRDPRGVSAGGDFVTPDEWYLATDLGSVFCESVALSQQLNDQMVDVEVDPDGDTGPELPYTLTRHYFTSVGLALESVVNGVIGQRDMRLRPSLPNPVINLQAANVTNPRTAEDGSALLVDITFSGTVKSAVCDVTPGTETGTIQKAYASVNDEPHPQSVVSLQVTKADVPAAQDRPYPYQGTFSHTLTGVNVTEGQNSLSLIVSDPIYHLSGTAEVGFEIEATPPAALGDGTGSVVTLELPVAGSTLAADEARLSITVDDAPLVNALVLKQAAGGQLYRSADGQAAFQFTQPPALSATVPDALHGYVTLPQSGWQGAAFSPLSESGANTGTFIWSAEETYGGYWGWTVSVGDIGAVVATGPGELHPYTVRLLGPDALLDQVHQIHIGGHALPVMRQDGIVRVGDALHPELPVTLLGMPVDAVSPAEPKADSNISQELAQLGVGWTWEEQDVPEADQDAVEALLTKSPPQANQGMTLKERLMRQAGVWWTNTTSVGYYQGFVKGFLDNPYSNAKDSLNTLAGIGKAAAKVAWLASPLGVMWEFTYGDLYAGEIKAATQAARQAKEFGSQVKQVLTEWGPEVFDFLWKLQSQTGDALQQTLQQKTVPGMDKLGPELRLTLEMLRQVLIMADDAWADMPPYERGYWQGYIAFEVIAVVISAVLTAPEGGVGGAALMARHVPKVRRIYGYLIKMLDKLSDVPGLGRLVTKLRGFNTIAEKLGDFCFVAGTPVLTLHGRIPIEKVKDGEWVWSRNDETGAWGWRPVVKTFTTHPDTLVHVRYDTQQDSRPDDSASEGLGLMRKLLTPGTSSDEITCTTGHLIHARRRIGGVLAAFVAAGALHAGDLLTLADGRDAAVREVSVEHATPGKTFTTYNFTVADHHTYFVGEQPVWVHNDGLDDCGKLGEELVNIIVKKGDEPSKYFDYLMEARGANSGKITCDKTWCNGYKKMTGKMVESFRKGDITDVDLLPTYNDIKNSLAPTATRGQIKSADMNVHHIVPKSALEDFRDVFEVLSSDHSLGDVAAVALSQADHDAITRVMNPWMRTEAYTTLQTAAEKARAIVNWYDANGHQGQATIAKAWLQKRGIW